MCRLVKRFQGVRVDLWVLDSWCPCSQTINKENRNPGNTEANILTNIIPCYRAPYYIYTIKEPQNRALHNAWL